MATVEVTMGLVREDDYAADEIVVEVSAADEFKGQDLLWQLITRVLITLLPPAQGWDRFKETYSNITEPGYWSARAAELDQLIKERALAEAEDGEVAHYSHREHIADCTVNGTALRALCGAFFVPMQDHATKPECPKCSERHSALPG
ncbi:hypothetical protein GOEFS_106_01110 [Gordonia effusa NBRC 100432]|uniref:DUF3039 domain-containing protein n=2 Tax=Gordonia effusa TaxID=263908 RepID=H0R562_9ACTN|nr:hypothetical protein GOEFS_106_01110 [Gordonia effusa NBRC 100432]